MRSIHGHVIEVPITVCSGNQEKAPNLTRRFHSDPTRRAGAAAAMPYEVIFSPLRFRTITIKNRILRSNVAGRFDNYDGSGSQTRIKWELKFARGGVGAIISSFVPVHPRGRILPNYATIDSDARVPFWRELGRQVHAHDCQFILQLSHGGRQ